MKRESVKVRDGKEFDHYFPRAKLITIVKKEGATVTDTLLLIPAVIRETAFHTRRFAKEVIQADTLEETCRRLWEFVYTYIAYRKDEDGKEQIRSPARTWHDRHNTDEQGNPMGVDCDCMTVFIVSVLYNLQIKNIFFRITKYKEKHFEHIYPIVIKPNGEQITIDCVVHNFNYEEPYSEKKDTKMDLEYLNGVSDSTIGKFTDSTDLLGIMNEEEALSQLGRILKRKASGGGGAPPPAKKPFQNLKNNITKVTQNVVKTTQNIAKKPVLNLKKSPEQKQKAAEKKAKVKKFLGKGLHVTNRINPVTVALRNGVLAGMKLNFLQIAGNLRWTYLSDAEAQKRGILMDRFNKLKTVREKLDKIFFGAGGKVENLKKAILTGKGNHDKAVPLNGLGAILSGNVMGLNEDMPLNQLLGQDIYYSENVEGLEGIEGLEGFSVNGGDLGSATAASVAAASTALTAIAGLIKSIGSIFPKNNAGGTSTETSSETSSDSGSQTSNETTTESGQAENSGSSASETGNESNPPASTRKAGGGSTNSGSDAGDNSGGSAPQAKANSGSGGSGGSNLPATTNTANQPEDENGGDGAGTPSAAIKAKAQSFWANNKKWIKPAGIIAGTLGIVALGLYLLKPKKKKETKLGLQGLKNKHKPKTNKLNLAGLKSKKKKAVTKHVDKKKSIHLF